MFTRVTTYSIKPESKEEFLDLMEEAKEIYLNELGGNVRFLRRFSDTTEWIEIHQFEKTDSYISQLEAIESALKDIRFRDKLRRVSMDDIITMDEAEYEEFMFIEHEEEE